MRYVSLFFLLLLAQVVGCSCDPNPEEAEPEPALCIDRLRHTIHPPAGVRVAFRVLQCDDSPVRALTDADITVINDEKGEPFGAHFEGGAVSNLGTPSDFVLFTVLALDMSDSIIKSNSSDKVIESALAFVNSFGDHPQQHAVAIYVFGRPNALRLVQDFTTDRDLLETQLKTLQGEKGLGTTDLYGAYMASLTHAREASTTLEFVERFVVILTDGTHEAGDESAQRKLALASLAKGGVEVFSVGIEGAYDESKLRELASSPEKFVKVSKPTELVATFTKIGKDVALKASSNYVVAVCTPIVLSDSSLTIKISVDSVLGSVTVPYLTDSLTGDLQQCSANELADICIDAQCGEVEGVECGACGNGETCKSLKCVP